MVIPYAKGSGPTLCYRYGERLEKVLIFEQTEWRDGHEVHICEERPDHLIHQLVVNIPVFCEVRFYEGIQVGMKVIASGIVSLHVIL